MRSRQSRWRKTLDHGELLESMHAKASRTFGYRSLPAELVKSCGLSTLDEIEWRRSKRNRPLNNMTPEDAPVLPGVGPAERISEGRDLAVIFCGR